MAIRTKADLREYILQELGYPVINVELTEDQLNNQIDKAVERFVEQGFSGSTEIIIELDVTAGTQTYELPDTVLAIKSVMKQEDSSDALFSAKYHMLNDFLLYQWPSGGGNTLSVWEATKGYMEIIDSYFTEIEDFSYNDITNKITFYNTIDIDKTFMLIGYSAILPDNAPDTTINNIFAHRWVREAATAFSRRQWGFNLSKTEGIPLPGGGTLNGGMLIDRGEAQIETLLQELEDRYEAPIDFFVG